MQSINKYLEIGGENMKKNAIIITIIVAVVALGAGFFGGMQYQKSQPRFGGNGTFISRQGGFGGAGSGSRFGGAGTGGARPVIGQIISSDATGITVKMTDGSTKIVIVSSSTSINKFAPGTKNDLKTGETVAVVGTQNSDGSVTAQNIQLNPEMRFGRASGSPSPTQ